MIDKRPTYGVKMSRPPERKRRLRRAVMTVAILAVAAAAGGWLLVSSTARGRSEGFTGYVVSDTLYMAASTSGAVQAVHVVRGQRVARGDLLFQLDPTVLVAESDQAQGQIGGSSARVGELQAVLAGAGHEALSARADVLLAQDELARLSLAQAAMTGAVAAIDIEKARAAHDGAVARRKAADAREEAAREAVRRALAEARISEAVLVAADRRVSDLSALAPASGRVEDVLYQPGERVAVNSPVVSIVPDGGVKVRFYAPQRHVASLRPGQRVGIACDGCPDDMTAVVEFVAPRPEFTPPVIYSLEVREKLVFLVEARPERPRLLTPGQPMDVYPLAGPGPAS